MKRCSTIAAATFMVAARAPLAQLPAIPVRDVTLVATSDSGVLQSLTHARILSTGAVLVNDGTRRRLILFDATLKGVRVIADTTPGAPSVYGSRPAAIYPHMGDSTLFADAESRTLVVVDPAGRMGRAIALPKTNDLVYFTGEAGPSSAFTDPFGRIIYRGSRPRAATAPPTPQPRGDGLIVMGTLFDSGSIVRANLETRALDTLALVRLPVRKNTLFKPTPTRSLGMVAFNPLPVTDDWTMMHDGTVAIVRAQDYHVDWIQPNGTLRSTPKMPFDWKRITPEEKTALLDSVRTAEALRRASLPPPSPTSTSAVPFTTVDVEDLSDFYPAIRAGFLRAAPDGALWILPSTSTLSSGDLLATSTSSTAVSASGLVYDVVSQLGAITERVRLPAGRTLLGVGVDGSLYLSRALGPRRILVERARVVR